ncbi:MAG TPA: SDR family NAD(P)-dependent oxidoreductase [Patescibacteria group bacterium]|nr:SDR family NAD(P)-dependent oxidoreductase [Patescibacteria group bacterium]
MSRRHLGATGPGAGEFCATAGSPSPFELVGISLPGSWDPAIPIAASRAGATGILDLSGLRDPAAAEAAVARFFTLGVPSSCGLLLDLDDEAIVAVALARLHVDAQVWVHAAEPDRLRRFFTDARARVRRVGLVVTSARDLALAELGPDLVVAKGHESGGRVGEETAFVLAQSALAQSGLPVLVWGGIGWHTAPACAVAGAAGAVLDWQLALLREASAPPAIRQLVARMDGSETAVVRQKGEARYRILAQPGLTAHETLDAAFGASALREAWIGTLHATRVEERAWPVGQDACFAASFAKRGATVGQVLAVLREHVGATVRQILASDVMRPGSPMAASQSTRYPVMQGPMTRVSDVAAFLDAVERGGALPMLATAVMRRSQLEPLMEETRDRMGERSWGVGILGFVDPALRAEQMEVIRRIRPPYAVIAGGRPGHAAELETMGIRTYLHVPSPAILESFLHEGARRFIFEGLECGGHVGPRSSFVLWESMIGVLLDSDLPPAAFADLHVYFAGGIHDATSSLMAAAIAQPLVERGARFGIEMGTAYLFTKEAVTTGAIVPTFQEMALGAQETVLFESGPGHAIRCVRNPCYDDFQEERTRLLRERVPGAGLRERLESRHMGRLRIASKGITREPEAAAGETPRYAQVPAEQQRREGMYMIGQVAALNWEVSTIADLHERVCDEVHRRVVWLRDRPPVVGSVEERPAPAQPLDIAIVGMSCLLPGAGDPAAFWENILRKKDLIEEIPADRFDADTWFDADPKARDRINSRWGGFVRDVLFDPMKYGIPPASIPSIEPAQLLALELVDRALRDAGSGGLGEDRHDGARTSVILGVGGGMADLGAQYAMRAQVPRYIADADDRLMSQLPEWTEDSFAGILLNVVAGRVSNRFNFGGVNFTVDAACASSLAAIYIACRELAAGTSDRVIAGGCDTIQGPFAYLCFSKAGALSPGGKPRVFDQAADGIAISEGLAAVVLKRRADAERDGDRIYAVLRSVSGGSDGRSRSMTAPHLGGQVRTLKRAYEQAGVSPASVTLFEAHGTGTALGDRTECQALTELLGAAGAGARAHALGSVKSMIGHTKCTAGVAGLIKSALGLYHRVLPPTINVEEPNRAGGLADGPLYVNTETRPWIRGPEPRRAAVSAFGFGGTNFHAVLEEYAADPLDPLRRDGRAERSAELFLFSAESREALARRVRQFAGQVRDARAAGATFRLADLAYTHHARRHAAGEDRHRLAIVTRDLDELATQIEGVLAALSSETAAGPWPRGVLHRGDAAGPPGRMAFLFPGQGSQLPNMMRELAVEFGEIGEALSQADARLRGRHPRPLSHYIFPPPSFQAHEAGEARQSLAITTITQPALGACSVGMMRLLESFGVRPDCAAGHSYGELTALHAAGAFDFDTLLDLSFQRGEAMLSAAPGGDADLGTMLAVAGDRRAVAAAIEGIEGVWLANTNSPRQTVISGYTAAVGRAREALGRQGLEATPIPVQCAFHTPLMARARDRFAAALGRVVPGALRFPVFSNTTAAAYPAEASAIPGRLLEQLVNPVQFAEQVEAMYASGVRSFVEVGPNQVLTRLVQETLAGRPHLAVHTGARAADSLAELLRGLAALALDGHAVSFDRLYSGRECALLDLALLAERAAQPPAAHLWLVNSAYARRAGEPRRDPAPLARMNAAPAALTAPVTQMLAAPPPAPPAQVARPSTQALAIPAPAAGVHPPRAAEVFLRAQETMRKFLESQEAILQAYFGDEPGAGARPPSVASRAIVREAVPAPAPAPFAAQVAPAPVAATVAPPPVSVAAPAEPPAATRVVPRAQAAVAAPAGDARRSTLIAIVAQRTGYPADMLDLAADMEADLGIDSIKRVEIIAAFRRAVLPAMKEPTPAFMDAMGTARTMEAILQAVRPFAGGPAEPAGVPASAPDSDAQKSTLIAIVAQRTGYPSDMLDLAADMEADLGIDSIKRVEIIAAFRRAVLPAMKEPTPAFMDAMGTARTMGEILQAVRPFAGGRTEPAGSPAAQGARSADAVAPAAVATGAAAPAGGVVALDGDARRSTLVRIVAERTGYPADMLDLAADMEADLGIDSIKRVEIIAAFRRAVLPAMKEPTPAFMDAVSGASTMRAILDAVTRVTASAAPPASVAPAAPAAAPAATRTPAATHLAAGSRTGTPAPVATERTPRCVVRSIEIPGEGRVMTLPAGGVVLLTDDGGGAAGALRERLEKLGVKAVVVPVAGPGASNGMHAAVEAARGKGRIEAAVHLAPARRLPVFAGVAPRYAEQTERTELQGLLDLAQALAPELAASAGGRFLFAAITVGGGDFGPASESGASVPWRGGIAGFMKCAALEWPGARIRAIDLAEAPDGGLCDLLLREWGEPGPVEIGYRGGRRLGLRAVEAALDGAIPAIPDVRLDERSVVLVTGGARGITAEVVKELGARSRARFILIGRTPAPEGEESPATVMARTAQELRGVLGASLRAGQPRVTPKELEARVQSILRAREVRGTLAALHAAGSSAEYIACDVSDTTAFRMVLAGVAARHPGIDAIIHGAGAIEDKLIVDKTEASFERVLRTKVDPLLTLLEAVPRARLRLLIVFSSVAGFFGNRGQSDYAAANEVLNRIAERVRRQGGVKVLSLNWGPWEGTGMVGDEVAAQFKSRGIGLVTIDQGRRAVWDEICHPNRDEVRIVLGPGPWVSADPTGAARREEPSARASSPVLVEPGGATRPS